MIITLNTRSEFIPGTLIMDKHKGVYGIVLSEYDTYVDNMSIINSYKVKSLNLSKNRLMRKFQLLIIKMAMK